MGQLKDEIFTWLSRRVLERGAQTVDELSAAIGTTIGTTRSENQDCAVALHYGGGSTTPPLISFVLCDGIGGMRDGGVCARLATATFLASLLGRKFEKASQRIIRAAHAANDEIFNIYRERGGTTLSSIIIQEAKDCAGINVGDSRIYRVAADRLTQITTDDTLANQIQHLRPDRPAAANPAFGKQLTQFIGMGRDVQLRLVDIETDSLDRGFLLTSDGVHNVNPDTLQDITLFAPHPLEVVKRLTSLAKWGKSTDNATVIYIDNVSEPQSEARKPSDQLTIWDSHSSLYILADMLSSGKERRPGRPRENRSKSRRQTTRHRQDEQHAIQGSVSNESQDSRSHISGTKAANGGKSSKREPLQLEILHEPDDKPAN